VLILLLIKLLKRIAAESPGYVWQESFKALAEELNASVKKNIMTGTFEGFSFKCSRVPFWIQLQFPIPLKLSIKKASGIEGLWKKLGLVLSINTRDESFDITFAVRTNNREIAQKILQNDNFREPIKKLFTLLTARHILITNKKIQVKFEAITGVNFNKLATFTENQPGLIKESLQQLSQLIHHTASAEELALEPEPKTRQFFSRFINFTILAIIIIGSFLGVGLRKYEPLEDFFLPGLKFILPYVFLFTAIVLFTRYWKLKKSNYLRLEVLGTLFACLLIFMIIGVGYFVFTNGYLDSSPGIKQVVYITDKKVAGKGYFIYFRLDDKDKKEIDIGVSEIFYKSVKTGDPVIITYKQGYHHVRWLVSYEKGNP
ncbi:hypothetical protein ACFLRT_01260, partial [Acidobacteriota bacterium]